MVLYFEVLLVGIVGMTIWIFFWKLSENFSESFEFPLGVLMMIGAITFVLSFLGTIGHWLDFCVANDYGIVISIIGLMLTFTFELVIGVTVGLFSFLMINKIKFWYQKLNNRKLFFVT